MSRRQLHEAERGVVSRRRRREAAWIREATAGGSSVRSCGMEAVDEPLRRAQAKLRKALRVGVSVPPNAKPNIQSRPGGSGDGDSGTLRVLTQRDLRGSHVVGGEDERTTRRCPTEKSDHLIVATKPVKAGGAKGVTG